MVSSLRYLLIQVQWALFIVLTYLIALFIAWQLLAKVDFLYPLWYDVLGIEQTIAKYGPQNRYRVHFEVTSKAERVRLFSAIVAAIHNQGRGLDNLVYHDPAGQPIAGLLTRSEIVHLQDVSRLVAVGLRIGWGAVIGWLLLGLLPRQKIPMPPVRRLLAMAFIAIVGLAIIILISGPVRVFYKLHTWVFPEGHAWFFYYQDSLMTMLMKAPDLFGYIALSLAALSFLVLLGIVFIGKQLYQRL